MNAPLPCTPLTPASGFNDWMTDRLTEARGVLADTTQHPDSMVILAARVVVGQTGDVRECADAIDLLQLLDRRPLHAIAAAAFPKGGAV